ncbi:MAG: hypothetical protein IKF38_06165 [Clostridia bacterium]|nr:hypothetical protein [Clostridia bacterium]
MIRIKGRDEYEVWCRNCKKTIIFDSPEDLKKDEPSELYCVICPLCEREIWFDGIVGHTLEPNFAKQVKPRKIYLEDAIEACEKFNDELNRETFEGGDRSTVEAKNVLKWIGDDLNDE